MSVTPAAVTLRPFHGYLHPAEGETVDLPAVLAHLRELQVLASVQSNAPARDEPCDLVLLLDDVDRIQVLREGKVSAGAPLTSFGPALAEALGLEVEIAGEFFDDPASLAQEWDHPDVLLCRLVDSSLPFLAHRTVDLVAGHVDGWTLIRFDRAGIDLDAHAWLPSDLPALLLSRDRASRTIQVVTRWNDLFGHTLSRSPSLTTTFEAEEISAAAAEALTFAPLSPDSDLSELLASEHFARADAAAVARALQSPMDERWTARVLAALDVPTLAAEVHEGRAEIPGSTRVRSTSGVRSLVDTVLRYYDAPPEEVARRTPYGKLYDRVQRHPVAAGAVIVTEVATSAALLAVGVRGRRSQAARTALVSGAAAGLLDAALSTALVVRRFSRRAD